MATRAQIVQELMDEFGKSSDAVRERISSIVGDVTITILSQDNGKFRRLKQTHTFTLSASYKTYLLPANFNTIDGPLIELDDSGNLLRKWEVVEEGEFHDRIVDDTYAGVKYAYISNIPNGRDGPGEYITLDATPETGTELKLFYYRKPLANDTDAIRNPMIIKEGARGLLPDFVQDAQIHTATFLRMLEGVFESPEETASGMILKPSRQQQRTNRLMHKIGRGQ